MTQESDRLINQLRAASFFDVFRYDAQLGNWVCMHCSPEAEKSVEAEVAMGSDTTTGKEATTAILEGILLKRSRGLLKKWMRRHYCIKDGSFLGGKTPQLVCLRLLFLLNSFPPCPKFLDKEALAHY